MMGQVAGNDTQVGISVVGSDIGDAGLKPHAGIVFEQTSPFGNKVQIRNLDDFHLTGLAQRHRRREAISAP